MKLPVSELFEELVRQGHITPPGEGSMDESLPGAFDVVPSIVTYGTPNIPVHRGVHTNAKLEQHTKGNFSSSN